MGAMEADTLVTVMRSTHFFGTLEPQHLERLAEFSTEVAWSADKVIFREGESDDKFYIITEGLVALETYIPNRGRVTIQTLGPNEILGWSAAVPLVEKKTASARTLLATHAIAIDAESLCVACDQDHDLGYVVYRAIATVIASRLKATRLQLLDMFSIGERK